MIEEQKNNAALIGELVPSEFYLSQNYPNPFKDKTTIKYCIPYKTNVKLTIFNSFGAIIKKLVNEEKNAGTYEVEFNAAKLQSGNYFLKLEAGEYTSIKKLILI